jgi:Protein of unknown function (DUF2934)
LSAEHDIGDPQSELQMSELKENSDRPYDVMVDKEIVDLAYHYWEQRGKPAGSPEVDWYRAVADVNRERIRHGLGLG